MPRFRRREACSGKSRITATEMAFKELLRSRPLRQLLGRLRAGGLAHHERTPGKRRANARLPNGARAAALSRDAPASVIAHRKRNAWTSDVRRRTGRCARAPRSRGTRQCWQLVERRAVHRSTSRTVSVRGRYCGIVDEQAGDPAQAAAARPRAPTQRVELAPHTSDRGLTENAGCQDDGHRRQKHADHASSSPFEGWITLVLPAVLSSCCGTGQPDAAVHAVAAVVSVASGHSRMNRKAALVSRGGLKLG